MSETAMLEGATTERTQRVEMRRVIRAKRERVYKSWTEPELIQQWFGPGKMTVGSAVADVRVGGSFRIEMAGSPTTCADGRLPAASGVYQEVVPNSLLCFTWRGDWRPQEETLVTVRLRDVEGGTELTLTHERFASPESAKGHEQGWTSSLEKLRALCER